MAKLLFDFDNAGIYDEGLLQISSKLEPTINSLINVKKETAYRSPFSSLNLPFDFSIYKEVEALASAKKKLNPRALVVIGIGGSNLGAQAVYEAVYGKFGNADFPLYFADTVDSDTIHALLNRIEQILIKNEKILLAVISKSGSTTETIANFEIFLDVLKKYCPHDYHHYIVAITDRDSALWHLAHDSGFDRLAIPSQVGGRYSIFSPVGLFPLVCAGIDGAQLLTGARDMVDACIDHNINKNPAARVAAILAYHFKNKITIHDLFIFDVALESLGKWYRQLLAESIGKKSTVGITPTVSIGSTDLHSVGQLYLGGPADKFTTFVTVEKSKHLLTVPHLSQYEKLVPHIQGKSLAQIMQAILVGTLDAYKIEKRPFIVSSFPEKNEYYLGQFLQFQMMSVMYLGILLEVNPFDQPHVELYKTKTRKILSDE